MHIINNFALVIKVLLKILFFKLYQLMVDQMSVY